MNAYGELCMSLARNGTTSHELTSDWQALLAANGAALDEFNSYLTVNHYVDAAAVAVDIDSYTTSALVRCRNVDTRVRDSRWQACHDNCQKALKVELANTQLQASHRFQERLYFEPLNTVALPNAAAQVAALYGALWADVGPISQETPVNYSSAVQYGDYLGVAVAIKQTMELFGLPLEIMASITSGELTHAIDYCSDLYDRMIQPAATAQGQKLPADVYSKLLASSRVFYQVQARVSAEFMRALQNQTDSTNLRSVIVWAIIIVCVALAVIALSMHFASMKRLSQHLQRSSVASRGLMRHVSHEVKNPLHGILGSLYFLARDAPSVLRNDHEYRDHITSLYSSSMFMKRVVSVSLLGNKWKEENYQPGLNAGVSLMELLKEELRMAQNTLEEHMNVHLWVQHDLPEVAGVDEQKIRLCLLNGLCNAVMRSSSSDIHVCVSWMPLVLVLAKSQVKQKFVGTDMAVFLSDESRSTSCVTSLSHMLQCRSRRRLPGSSEDMPKIPRGFMVVDIVDGGQYPPSIASREHPLALSDLPADDQRHSGMKCVLQAVTSGLHGTVWLYSRSDRPSGPSTSHSRAARAPASSGTVFTFSAAVYNSQAGAEEPAYLRAMQQQARRWKPPRLAPRHTRALSADMLDDTIPASSTVLVGHSTNPHAVTSAAAAGSQLEGCSPPRPASIYFAEGAHTGVAAGSTSALAEPHRYAAPRRGAMPAPDDQRVEQQLLVPRTMATRMMLHLYKVTRERATLMYKLHEIDRLLPAVTEGASNSGTDESVLSASTASTAMAGSMLATRSKGTWGADRQSSSGVLPPLDAEDTGVVENWIAVVDDERSNQKLLQRALSVYWDCQVFRDGLQLLEFDNPRYPLANCAAVLTDIVMAEVGGIELARRLRDLRYAGVILAVSGNTEPSDCAEFTAAGMNGWISKPFNVSLIPHKLLTYQVPHTRRQVTAAGAAPAAAPSQ